MAAPWLRRVGALFWNGDERRLRALWRLATLAGLLAGLGSLVDASGLLPTGTSGASYLIRVVAQLLWVTGGVWLAVRAGDRRRFRALGFGLDRDWFADLGFGLALGAGLMAGVFAVESALGWVTVIGTFQTPDPQVAFAVAVWVPVALFAGVGYLEELLFRGYLLRNLAEGLGFDRLGGPRGGLVLACALSSGVFALAHLGNPNAGLVSTANIGAAGVFLSLGYLMTGQLAIPIGLHVTWNLFQGTAFGFPVSGIKVLGTSALVVEQSGPAQWTGGVFGPEGGLLGLLAMGVGSALTCLWVRRRRGELRLATELLDPPWRPPPRPSHRDA